MNALEKRMSGMSARMQAMKNNDTLGMLGGTVMVGVAAAGIAAAEVKTGSTNIAPMAAVAGLTASMFTSGMGKRTALELGKAGLAIASYNATKTYMAAA